MNEYVTRPKIEYTASYVRFCENEQRQGEAIHYASFEMIPRRGMRGRNVRVLFLG